MTNWQEAIIRRNKDQHVWDERHGVTPPRIMRGLYPAILTDPEPASDAGLRGAGGTPEASHPPQPSLSALLTPGLMQISGHWSHSAQKKCFQDLETASRCQQSGAKTMKSSVWQVLGEITNYCVWYGVFQLYPYPTSKKICYGGFTGCEKWVMWKNVTLYLSSVTCCCLHVILVSFKPQFE